MAYEDINWGPAGNEAVAKQMARIQADKEYGDMISQDPRAGRFGLLERSKLGQASLANQWRYQAFKQEDAALKGMEDYRKRLRDGAASAALMQRNVDMANAQRQAQALQGRGRGDALAMRGSAYGAGAAERCALNAGMQRRAAEIAQTEAQYQKALGRYAGIESDILRRATEYDKAYQGLLSTTDDLHTQGKVGGMQRDMALIGAVAGAGSAAVGTGVRAYGGGGYGGGGGASSDIIREVPY